VERKKPSFSLALIPIIVLIFSLYVGITQLGADAHIPILFAMVVTGLLAMFVLKFSWSDLEEGMIATIKMGMQAILILMVIGTIIGTWILSGTVPTMIYYGLKILSPAIFLVATCIISAIVALATGSSWTTAGTIGVALIGIGGGLGLPLPWVAGAIVSGAYFGDKMSPLSDTTNLAPTMAGTNLFEHIKHMLYTGVPAIVIALIIYGVMGAVKGNSGAANMADVNVILDTLSANFNITPWLLIPPVLVIVLVALKVPALPGLISGTILGGIFAAIFQKAPLADIVDAAHYGFVLESDIEIVNELLSKGGLDSMLWTVSLILLALAFGGMLEKTGMLHVIGESILKLATNTGSLVLATVLTAIATNILTADQYLSIVLPGRMFKESYEKKGLHPKVLSRVLEGSGTVTSPLIPWNTCGATMNANLGVSPQEYFFFAFFNLLVPVINVIYGYLGITMTKLDSAEEQQA
jgi:Na+:H+ antiporter, NhaC family